MTRPYNSLSRGTAHLILCSLDRLGLEQVQVRVASGSAEGLLQVGGVFLVRGHGQLRILNDNFGADLFNYKCHGHTPFTSLQSNPIGCRP